MLLSNLLITAIVPLLSSLIIANYPTLFQPDFSLLITVTFHVILHIFNNASVKNCGTFVKFPWSFCDLDLVWGRDRTLPTQRFYAFSRMA
eukprot:gene5343-3842_t